MKITLISYLVIVSFVVAGCASTSLKEATQTQTNDIAPVKAKDEVAVNASASFEKQNGSVKIIFDSAGNWESISSIASGAIAATTYDAKEQASTIASMRAKRNIAEFLSSQISSTRTMVVVSKTLQKAKETIENQTNGQPISLSDDENSKIDQELKDSSKQINLDKNSFTLANIVREQISESSNAILKGLTVVSQNVSTDGKAMQVELRITKKNINLASAIRQEMQ